MKDRMLHRPTVQEIALASGYSPATVSKALHGYKEISRQTTALIREKAAAMGYMSSGRERFLPTAEKKIALLSGEGEIPGIDKGAFTVAFSRSLAERGYDLVIPGRRGIRETALLGELRAAGLCLLCDREELAGYMPLLDGSVPAVTAGAWVDSCSAVCYDCREAVNRLEDHLREAGYTRTVLICGSATTQERLLCAFFLQRKREEDRGEPEGDLLPCIRSEADPDGIASVRPQVQRVLAMERKPDCILLPDGRHAAAAAAEILRCGYSIPEDYAVASLCGSTGGIYAAVPGAGGAEEAPENAHRERFPSITAILPDHAQMGAAAAEMLTEALEQPLWHVPELRRVPGILALGTSTLCGQGTA